MFLQDTAPDGQLTRMYDLSYLKINSREILRYFQSKLGVRYDYSVIPVQIVPGEATPGELFYTDSYMFNHYFFGIYVF